MATRLASLRILFIAALLCISAAVRAEDPAGPVDYSGHVVCRVVVTSHEQFQTLQALTDDFWTHAETFRGRSGARAQAFEARFSPRQFQALKDSGLPHRVLIPDVGDLIETEAREVVELRGGFFYDTFQTYETVVQHLNDLAATRPDIATVVNIGTSIQGRAIVGLRITGTGGGPAEDKPAVFYQGCQHAREWITVPVTTYIAESLITGYGSDPLLTQLADRAVWYVVPIVNPDGYVYTHTSNRLWRKNRRNNGGGTFGVDLNRNWAFQWGGGGASTNPGDDTYRGSGPFSEPESDAMADFITARPEIVAFADIHSFSQLLMWPWGYTETPPADNAQYSEVAQKMVQAIASVHGTIFQPGAVADILYIASGSSSDWTYGARGIFSFAYELRDTGQNGFILPADQIIPSCEETLPSILIHADYTTAPVRIDLPYGLPDLIAPGEPTPVTFRVTDGLQTVNPAQVSVYVRTTESGPFTQISASPIGGGDYQALLPARSCGADTQFYIAAAGDQGGSITAPLIAPGELFTAPVGVRTVIATDNFETLTSWTVSNQDVQTGAWVRVDPIPTSSNGQPLQPGDDASNPGTLCYVTGQGSNGGAAGNSDLDGGPTRLTSPAFDLSSTPEARINFAAWFATTGNDSMTVELSNDDGSVWQHALTITHAPAWNTYSIRVADVVPPSATIRIRFSASDNPNDSLTEAAVDDVVVDTVECVPTDLLGDADGDCDVDFGDLNVLLANWGQTVAPGSSGDTDEDGDVDFDDLNTVLVNWGQTC